uniref:Putative nuclease HARBI1 n=1 Tax=Gouania willdenowi TaxID=441366 RepID=A0A8C5GQ69_GOUWI
MAFPLPLWLAVQDELLRCEEDSGSGSGSGPGSGPRSCFDSFDDEALFELVHLNRPCAAFITDAVRSHLQADKSPLSVESMVLVALNYYAHGVLSTTALQKVGLNKTECLTTVVSTVSEVIAAMADQFISFPMTDDARCRVASRTKDFCGIPNLLGILAPAHFKIRASPYEINAFRSFINCQGFTSVVSQIICDCDGNILSVEKCCAGRENELDMWEASLKQKEMEEGLHGSFRLIGKIIHPSVLYKHVLTPVLEPSSRGEYRFNAAHGKLHNVMLAAISEMKRRFECLMQLGFAHEGSLNKKSIIIKSCCVLHNIAKKFSVPSLPVQYSLGEMNPEILKVRQEVIASNFSYCDSEWDRITTEEEEQ